MAHVHRRESEAALDSFSLGRGGGGGGGSSGGGGGKAPAVVQDKGVTDAFERKQVL